MRQLWRQIQALQLGTWRISGWLDHRFYRSQVGELPPGFSPELHYLRHGWREGRQPHPLFNAEFYGQQCLNAGLGQPQGPPLLHFLRHGWRRRLRPSPLFEAQWWDQQRRPSHRSQAPSLAAVHPLGAWALQLSDHQDQRALERLLRWHEHGLAAAELRAIGQQGPPLPLVQRIPEAHQLRLAPNTALHWSSHTWLQHLPLKALSQLERDLSNPQGSGAAPLTLVWLADVPEHAGLNLNTLLEIWRSAQTAHQVITTHTGIARLLQRMNIPASIELLTPGSATNGWLSGDQLLSQASSELGLPPPAGLAEPLPIVLGEAGIPWSSTLGDGFYALPGWEHLLLSHPQQARAQAAWLQSVQLQGHSLVLLNPRQPGLCAEGLQALVPPPSNLGATWQEPLMLHGLFNERALLHELDWHRQGCPPPSLEATPQPERHRLWSHPPSKATPPRVSVCISLHNYAHTIERALHSVRDQSLPLSAVELIVVDDASTDTGAETVVAWLNAWGREFHSAALVQHQRNAGLAAARNTAFAEAQADWCFVLDADNLLHPSALLSCLQVAEQCDSHTAVVHPLIALDSEQSTGAHQREGLHGIALWQRQRFVHGNHIDAMALVRRTAWAELGGYRHIPGGWEDFDFWCCLIEAGWHGVSLPRVVASYIAHSESMLANQTNHKLRQLSRLLQSLHPWLELEAEGSDPAGGAHHR